jgi:iron complex transport system ATP-binding protein
MSEQLIEVSDLSLGYKGDPVIRGVSLCVKRDEQWAVIGKNGTGKSTFIRAVAGLLPPLRGAVKIDGKRIETYHSRARARRIAYVPQKAEAVIPYTVRDFVLLGRYARMGLFGMPGSEDIHAADEALTVCDVDHLRNRMMNTLSGGEIQRVLLAGALAQESRILLLDEPTTFLDPAHERLFLDALATARKTKEITTVMVTHDINTALSSCTHVLALLDGAVAFANTVGEFRRSCPGMLNTVFGIPFTRFTAPDGDREFYAAEGGHTS